MKVAFICLALFGLSFAVPTSNKLQKLADLLENELTELKRENGLSASVEGREVKDTDQENDEFQPHEFTINPMKRGFYNFQSSGYPTGYTEYCTTQSFMANIAGYSSYSLKVTFTDFDIEGANSDGSCNDKVVVYDGYTNSDPVLGEFCGKLSPFSVYTSGQYIRVEFQKLRNGVMGKGFTAEFDYLRIADIPSDANQFDSPAPAPAPAAAPSTSPSPTPSSSGNVGPDADGVYIINEGVRDACLESHNAVRALHQNTPSMTYDASLEPSAQEFARYLAATGLFEHSDDRGNTGENLYKRWEWGDVDAVSASRATFSWYEERHDYDFSSGQSTGGVIGHFTQVVWTDSVRVACGVAKIFRDGFTETIIVGRYAPPGNWIGQNTAKVMSYQAGATFPTTWQELEP